MTILNYFDYKRFSLKDYKYWHLLLWKNGAKLGSCVAILKREAFPLSSIKKEELAEFQTVSSDIENALKQLFNPTLFNYHALMFSHKHIHFLIIPRYSSSVTYNGKVFTDDFKPVSQLKSDSNEPRSLKSITKQLKIILTSS